MKITLYEHPLAVVAPQVFQAESLGEWLLQHYGDVPTVNVQVFAGEPSAETEITGNIEAILNAQSAEYTILQSPGGLDPVSWLIIAAVAIVSAIIVVSLVPKPEMPGNVNRTQQSPNNALASRQNKVRMLERVEDIYGTVLSTPSLMMPTYTKYIADKKYEYGYYCVGRGYYDIAELRDGDTLISEIAGASASVYAPFTSPNSGHAPMLQIGAAIVDDVLTAARAIEVDGITLKALNQVQAADAVYTFTPDVGGGIITQVLRNPNFNSVATVGASVAVTMTDFTAYTGPGAITVAAAGSSFTDTAAASLFVHLQVGDTFTTSGFANAANNGTFTISTKPSSNVVTVSGSLVNESTINATFGVTRNYTGTYPIIEVGDGFIRLSAASTLGWKSVIANHTCSIPLAGVTDYTDWITLNNPDRTEVWCNVIAPQGMYKDNGGKVGTTVAFTVYIEQLSLALVPTGLVETVSGSLTGAATDEKADTLEHITSWVGPARVRMRRTTPYDYAFAGTVMDEIKWADLYSISPVSKTEFGNKTTIHTITQATSRATAVKARQLNCVASRKIPTYDGTSFSATLSADGHLASGMLHTSSKLCDIIAAVSVDPKIGARDLATEVDMAQIWGVQQQLDAWHAECGQFNYTFDSDNTSFEETLALIANAGFCIAYRQNGKIRLALDQLQPASTALFTHRNKKPNAETITRKFASDADYDGVEFVYSDPDTKQSETITLPLDGSYSKLKKYEIVGIRSFAQAWKRANREYQKLMHQRISIDTTTTLDARSLLPNARIDVVDNTRFKSYDGEVVDQVGLLLTLSQRVEFTPGQPHSLVLMRRDGSLQSIPVTAGPTNKQVLLQNLPSEAIVTTNGVDGIRTIYSFAADTARGAMAYLVQEIDLSDQQYCNIKAVNYSPDYYLYDNTAVPARDSVIS